MLFNSYEFLFLFLPVTLGFAALFPRVAIFWLTACSLFFFGYWDPQGIPLLLVSITFNYIVGSAITRAVMTNRARAASAFLAVGVTGDMVVLAWFKYAGFLGGMLHGLTGWPAAIPEVALPIGISFFTFTQIAFLVDARQRCIPTMRPVEYALFVSYFPHLVAGPIIHHAQVVPQFRKARAFVFSPRRLAVGGTIFAIGLFKKVMIADSMQPYVAQVFDSPGVAPTFFQAWLAALSYTFQLYFDFSGYSDMAIGLSFMLGVSLPLNFASPYKATSIIDFWRRWHISLSQFLRDYLYIPLGGSRSGLGRYGNILVTMVLGGLWHGAAWTFVVWGGIHGLFLVINHGWRALRGPTKGNRSIGRVLSWCLTFLGIVVGWVFFRAASLEDAFRLLRGLAGLNGFDAGLDASRLPGAFFFEFGNRAVPGAAGSLLPLDCILLIVVCFIVCLRLPNTQEIVGKHFGGRKSDQGEFTYPAWMLWHPTLRWALFAGSLLALSLAGMIRSGEFMYFQF